MELKPLDINDLKRMLGEKEIHIEQLTQAIYQLEQEPADKPKEPAPPGREPGDDRPA